MLGMIVGGFAEIAVHGGIGAAGGGVELRGVIEQ